MENHTQSVTTTLFIQFGVRRITVSSIQVVSAAGDAVGVLADLALRGWSELS